MTYQKLILSLVTAVLISSFVPPSPARAQDPVLAGEPESGAVVCPPDVYLNNPGDCLPVGPSAYLTEMARLGLSYPPRPLPMVKPDPILTELPYRYFKTDEDTVPVLSGPGGDAIGQFLPGFVYVSYIDRVESGGVYYMLQNGGWIPGKGSRIGEYSRFQGKELTSTPATTFAWPLPFYTDSIPVHTAPGYSTPQSGNDDFDSPRY